MTIYFFIYPLVFVFIEKIYQTVKKVFHPLSKHLEFREKYFSGHHISTLFSVYIPDDTPSLVFDIINTCTSVNWGKVEIIQTFLYYVHVHCGLSPFFLYNKVMLSYMHSTGLWLVTKFEVGLPNLVATSHCFYTIGRKIYIYL